MTTAHYLGAHTIDAGGIHMAVRRAGNAGMTALQVFTAIPKYYNERISTRPERVERFRAALGATDIRPERVVSHGAYVLNVATPDQAKWTRARDGARRRHGLLPPGRGDRRRPRGGREADRDGDRARARDGEGRPDPTARREHRGRRRDDGAHGRGGR